MAGFRKLDRNYAINFRSLMTQDSILSILDMLKEHGYLYSFHSHHITESGQDELVINTWIGGKRRINYLLQKEIGRKNFTIEEVK